MALHYLETGSTDARYNLAFEEFVLENRRQGDWLLLWQNADSVIIGLNQNAAEEVDPAFIRRHGIRVVRRMTGGGAVYHDLGNLNYSFITDAEDPAQLSMEVLARPVCRALEALGVRAELSGRNDICIDGKKVSGTAQRLSGGRVLHHGTLLFDSDAEMLSGALRADPEKFRSKAAQSVRSRVCNIRDCLPGDMELREFWAAILAELGRDGLVRESLDEAELAEVRRIAEEKYGSWDWNWGRSPDFGFRVRRRFPAGSLELCLDLHAGRIRDAAIFGDFLALRDCGPAREALLGRRFERGELEEALRGLPLREYFGGLGLEEILGLIFGEDGENEGP